jgi:hypothetical protein
MVRLMFLPSLIAWLAGCTTADPERNAAATYINTVQPLMLENRLLADQRNRIAAGIYNGTLGDAEIVKAWNEDIIPLSTHLHQQAALVEVPPEWVDMHATLVVTWQDRSHAYIGMADALALADEARWDEARKLHGLVVKREENWFDSARGRLAPLDLELEQFP